MKQRGWTATVLGLERQASWLPAPILGAQSTCKTPTPETQSLPLVSRGACTPMVWKEITEIKINLKTYSTVLWQSRHFCVSHLWNYWELKLNCVRPLYLVWAAGNRAQSRFKDICGSSMHWHSYLAKKEKRKKEKSVHILNKTDLKILNICSVKKHMLTWRQLMTELDFIINVH